ncbi:MAG: ABC transporter substrate-binding protein [Actinobacteria bacterium]|nr:ABC transporter substrate-binding protein [Actinomycetota bacterium]
MNRSVMIAAVALVGLALGACANPATDDAVATETPNASASESPDTTEPASEPENELAAAEAREFDGTTVSILGQWVDAEGDNFELALADFAERTGIDIQYDGVSDYETVLNVRVESGDTPDLAQLAQPGLMREFQSEGHLVDVSTFLDRSALEEDYAAWIDLTEVDGGLYGLFYRANGKSIVWYPVQAFADNGYEVPQTWNEMMALSERIQADGNGAPWCVAQEHGDATGWVATDWVEDVLLRTAPAETYDAWVAGELAFDDPAVIAAAEKVGEIFFADGMVYGGPTAINSTFVGDAQTPMFDEAGPKCWLHKQAAWIPDFWPKDANEEPLFTPGEDSAFFYFPPIDEAQGRPVLGGGDMIVMFEDRPEVRAVMQFLATPEGAQGWIEQGGFLSANASTPTDWYETYTDQELARIFADATTVRFDASDSMPAEVGQGTFWSGMVEWISAGGADTEGVFGRIADSWPAG